MSSTPLALGPIGQPLRRKEDDRLLRGQGRFSDDFSLPGQVYAAMVRSPHPHARIVAIEAERALVMPGVLGVFTGADVAREGLGAIPHSPLKTGIDRIELRRRNLIDEAKMPYANPFGMVYDSGRYAENMVLAMRLADWSGFDARRAEASARGRLLGRGLANYVESSVGTPREQARMTVRPEGIVEIVTGTQSAGQGHETSFAQVAAERLGLDVDAIRVRLDDTDLVGFGGGTHSGRSMRMAGAVIALAAGDLIAEGKRRAAKALEAAEGDIAYASGRFSVVGTDRDLDLFELPGGLAVVRDNEMHEPVFPNGCHVCEVEVDPETGAVRLVRYVAVDDVGRPINPLIVEGQIHGGIVQGIGQALCEACIVDGTSGQTLTGSLMDYAVPRAADVPAFATCLNEVPSPTNALGVKAGGEGGTTPAPPVIASALADARRPVGVTDIPLPATPHAMWRAIHAAQGISSH